MQWYLSCLQCCQLLDSTCCMASWNNLLSSSVYLYQVGQVDLVLTFNVLLSSFCHIMESKHCSQDGDVNCAFSIFSEQIQLFTFFVHSENLQVSRSIHGKNISISISFGIFTWLIITAPILTILKKQRITLIENYESSKNSFRNFFFELLNFKKLQQDKLLICLSLAAVVWNINH